jgi:hypothetical protein
MNKTNRDRIDAPSADRSNLDRILVTEEELVPTSGFLASVMERVQEEATAPPPIPFPWKRTLPGMVFIAGVFGWGGFELAPHALNAAQGISFATPHLSVVSLRPLEQAGWVALALGVSLASWILSRRLAGRSGLL